MYYWCIDKFIYQFILVISLFDITKDENEWLSAQDNQGVILSPLKMDSRQGHKQLFQVRQKVPFTLSS